MSNIMKGRVYRVDDTVQVTDTFKKRLLILEVSSPPDYKDYFPFEFVQDRVKLLDGLQPGETVQVTYDPKGRLWTNKEGVEVAFLSFKAWGIDRPQETNPGGVTGGNTLDTVLDNDQSDLPF